MERDPLASMDNDDWGRAIAEAVAIALPFAPQDAEDLVQDAALRVFEGKAPWNPKETSLPLHLAQVGLKARSNQRRSERRRRRPSVVAKLIAFFDERVPTPQELFFEQRRKAERFEAVTKKLADDPEALQIVRLVEQDVLGVEEQADQTGMSVAAVRNARRRIIHIGRQLDVEAAREDKDKDKVAES